MFTWFVRGKCNNIFIVKLKPKEQKIESQLLDNLVSASSCVFYLFRIILTYPWFQIGFAFVYCDPELPYYRKGTQCYEGIHLLHFTMGIFILIVTLASKLTVLYILVDTNPWSKSIYAKFYPSYQILRFSCSFVFPLLTIIDLRVREFC